MRSRYLSGEPGRSLCWDAELDVVRWKRDCLKMGKDQEWVQAVKTQDVQAINRILSRCKTNKSKLLGSHKKTMINIQDDDGSSALHQAVTANNLSTVKLLLDNGAQVDLKDNKGKRALHCAAQLGNCECVHILLEYGSSVNDQADNGDIPLHLACRQGFADSSEIMMSSGACYNLPNRQQKNPIDLACEFGRYGVVESFLRRHLSEKTCTNDEWRRWLQLAAANGHMDVVRLLTACCNEDTAEDVWADDKLRGMKLLLKDLPQHPRAIAVADYDNPSDTDYLPLKQGDLVTVLEQNMDGRWKGSVLSSDGRDCRTGYFPNHVVQLLDRPVAPEPMNDHPGFITKRIPRTGFVDTVGGSQRTGTLRSATIKKVAPPTVPGITNRCSYTSSSYDSPTVGDVDYGGIQLDKIVTDSQSSSVHFDPSNTTGMIPSADCHVLEDQGIEIEVSPGRESPGGSSVGCLSRHSTASVDSGRSSIPSTDTKVTQRIPVQIYDSCQINTYEDCVNVAEMLIHNVPDAEILKSWLIGVHFEEYTQLFLQAGYDMPTVSRMTPEDLTAVGITKPVHRRKLKAEIAKLNISDGIPDYKPDTLLEWLQLLRLEEYHDTLCQQGYNTVDKVADLAWEDLEEIGIQKLGHQKKIMLAIKRIRDINSGIRRPSLNPASQQTGRGALSRPQTLGPVHPISSYQYHCQEIAITTVKVKTSPSNEICNAPELKTFQQSPTRNDSFKWPTTGEALSPSHQFEPHMVAIQVRSPNRGHSLENLDSNDSVTMAVPHHSYLNNSDTWYDTVSAWRQHGYDTDSELSIRGDHGCAYEADGTATLHRPKGLVKPRPIAKIVAKSRHNNQVSDIDSVKSQLKCIDQKIEQATTQGSNQSGTQTNGSSIYGTLKYKRTPPPPPKRSNSIKSDSSVERSIEVMKDEAFATCVKGLASHFNISTKTSDSQPEHNQERTFSPEEFPPPPSPLPSATAESYSKLSNVPAPVRNDSEPNDVPELFSNAMFRQRRKHSIDSSVCLSNTESNTMPFANENVSTIKQKVAKPQSSLQDTKSPSPSVLRKTNLILPGNKPLSAKRRNSAGGDRSEDTGFTRKVAGAAEDVIDDIEHMLTNLSNQLDAMLEDEQLTKET